jgi:hypothetical protein
MTHRTPIDLQAATRDIRNRCSRIIGHLEPIAQSSDPILADPRDTMLALVLALHELESTKSLVKRAWWP